MFGRTYEIMKKDNVSFWAKTHGNYSDKAMPLLRNYCGYVR